MALDKKYLNLKTYLKSLGSVVVAFSGGVDSTFLLKVASDVLGENVLAMTACSAFIPERELSEAIDFCKKEGIKHVLCDIDILHNPDVVKNPPNRCYICKKAIFSQMLKLAESHGIQTVVEGSNRDDLGDYRPGLRAIAELNIKSPLQEAELTKSEIRELSKQLNLPTWEKPSFACLASRMVYGEEITEDKLQMVEQAEQLLMNLGFEQFRVRVHGNLARIEVDPKNFQKIMETDIRVNIVSQLQSIGFSYVTLDMKGYRTGSMNEVLKK